MHMHVVLACMPPQRCRWLGDGVVCRRVRTISAMCTMTKHTNPLFHATTAKQ